MHYANHHDDDHEHEPVFLTAVFQANLDVAPASGKRTHHIEHRRVQATWTEDAANAAATLTAEKANHGAAFADLRKLSIKMGGDYQQRMAVALASARMDDGKANAPSTLHRGLEASGHVRGSSIVSS